MDVARWRCILPFVEERISRSGREAAMLPADMVSQSGHPYNPHRPSRGRIAPESDPGDRNGFRKTAVTVDGRGKRFPSPEFSSKKVRCGVVYVVVCEELIEVAFLDRSLADRYVEDLRSDYRRLDRDASIRIEEVSLIRHKCEL